MNVEWEIAMHVLAQLTRFVVRKQMTEDEAAVLAFKMAKSFLYQGRKE